MSTLLRVSPFALAIFGQIGIAEVPRSSFEVVSIKPHPGIVTSSADPSVSGTRITGTASTLLDLITTAFDIKYSQIAKAPAWASSDHFDLAARASGETVVTKDELRAMLKDMLDQQFQMKSHFETNQLPAYALVVDKSKQKFKDTSIEESPTGFVHATGTSLHLEYVGATMGQLARQLSNTAGRPVVDNTGLTGRYWFNLDWISGDSLSNDPNSQNLFTAVQDQLGLKLQPVRRSVSVLVIDHVDRPSPN